MRCPWRRAEALAVQDGEVRRLAEAMLRVLSGAPHEGRGGG